MIEIKIITKNPNKVLKYLSRLNINIYKTTYDNLSLFLKINKKDLPKVKKIYNYKITNYYGLDSFIRYIKTNILQIIYTILIIITITIMTRFIIDINVLTEDKQLQKIILNELDKSGIKKYSVSKSNTKINNIKEHILYNNKDLLEWLNIEKIGMTYKINIEQRIIKNKTIKKRYCNIYSTKDATISKIITHKGVEQVSINDSVKKGTLLISGDITYNEETKKQVCASGTVYGKTWYTINIKIPTKKEIIIKQDKTRYNILIEHNNHKKKLFKPKLTKYINENKKILSIMGTTIYFQKEIQIKKETKELQEPEITKLIEEKINETMDKILKGNYHIIDRKVLKKHINNSTIELDIFIVAEEQISTIEE